MSTTLDQLVQRTRRFMRDYPVPASALAVSLSNTSTSITTADSTVFAENFVIEVDYETILCSTSVSSTVTRVVRGWAGTTAVSHANTSTILVRPAFFSGDIIDALNAAKDEMYPYVYKPVLDTSLTADNTTYEFTIPSTIKHLSKVELKVTGDFAYRRLDDWEPRRAATPTLQFRRPPPAGTIRLHGFGPFDDLAASADTVDSLFPTNAIRAMELGASSRLLSSGEAGRSRTDVGLRDDREAAVRPGNAVALANVLERRFEKALSRATMPPFAIHVRQVL